METLWKCRRCRWKGVRSDLINKPHPKDHSRSDMVCPNCSCKSFTQVEQPK
ncbi:hypothetical protein C4K35_5110 [Pseudomonas chlororaphis subsp. piscium]|nr:hypothetical protein C4K35_5110 [Pseudomonas chlororaphis subsp. piscium]